MRIKSLHRYAVKGLSGDSLPTVTFHPGDGTLEDDRRFALLYDDSREEFDEDDPKWLHKVGFHSFQSVCFESFHLVTIVLTFTNLYNILL